MRTFLIVIVVCHTMLYTEPIILWDLHGVLLARKNPLTACFNSCSILGIFKELHWPLIKDLLSLVYTNFSSNTVISHDFILATQKHNAPCIEALVLAIANAQQPMPGMQSIVQELCDLGYQQQIASNISHRSLEILANPRLSPEFTPIFCALELDSAQIAQHHNGEVLKKPNPEFFKQYLEKNNIDLTTQPVLLIDDTLANCISAQKLGFDTIYFKNPYQLRDELIERGIAVTPPSYHITNQHVTINLRSKAISSISR